MPKNDGLLDGFYFRDGEIYDAAAKDQQIIAYLEKQVDLTNAEAAKRVYDQAIAQDLFSTVVGYSFLKELQEALIQEGYVSKDGVAAIPVKAQIKTVEKKVTVEVPAPPTEKEEVAARHKDMGLHRKADTRYRKMYTGSFVINIILAVTIGVMFFILLSSNLPNIVNYRTKIVNEYASWEAELKEKEKALDTRELELNDRESALQGIYGDETVEQSPADGSTEQQGTSDGTVQQ